MNQEQLVANLSAQMGVSKTDAEAGLKTLGRIVGAALSVGEEVTLPGIGKLKVKVRSARTGRNPRTGEAINIPAKHVVTFTTGKALKDVI
jgi:DNA-binding protein HU-beta